MRRRTATALDPNAPKPIRASKIILVGDSTTAVQGGWGGSFCAEHVTSFAACVNLARGGRSSGSYIAEGSWELALAEATRAGLREHVDPHSIRPQRSARKARAIHGSRHRVSREPAPLRE